MKVSGGGKRSAEPRLFTQGPTMKALPKVQSPYIGPHLQIVPNKQSFEFSALNFFSARRGPSSRMLAAAQYCTQILKRHIHLLSPHSPSPSSLACPLLSQN